ncbi:MULTISPECIES: ion channel [Pseudomonas]|uniref:Pentapeptide repeat-containing protein n=1 Tax=Pseudomonas khorasanensis TaxID=2745508 RepID=A0A923F1F6_9PSED|nr:MULTISPECIES: ion channel [Pseudomonas]MBV4485164.1 pentapeptide repeat-containing protein [Pseudomonas khorasanensis]
MKNNEKGRRMFNGVAVKLLQKIKVHVVPNGGGGFGISEEITQTISIKSLPSSPEISFCFINFDFDSITPKERQVSGKTFTKCIFSHKIIEEFTFKNCIFVGCMFNGAAFVGVEFHDCEFRECFFYKARFKDTYIDPRSFIFSKEWHWFRANVNAGLFQSVYNNSKSMHQEEFAMHSDRKFQFYRRYQYLYGNYPEIYRFLKGLLFDYLLGHGYGIKNTLFMTLVSILGFAWLLDGNVKSENGTFFETLYFTVVSLTTVGYGEITPRHELAPMVITIVLLLSSIAWCAVVTAIIVKRIVK